jgi:hypothetical protein
MTYPTPAATAQTTSDPTPDFQPLHPRALRLWQLTDVIAYLVLLAFLIVGGLLLMWLRPSLAAPVVAGGAFFGVVGGWSLH